MYDNKKMKTTVIFLVYIVVTFILIMVTSKIQPLLCAACFAQLFIVVIIVAVVSSVRDSKRQKIECTEEVTATVVDSQWKYGSHHRKYYRPVYQYYYNGQMYEQGLGTYSGRPIRFNSQVNLMINPNDPNDCYIKK